MPVVEAVWGAEGVGTLNGVSNVEEAVWSAEGSSSVAFVGSRRLVARCTNAYTYAPPPTPAWAGSLRRSPMINVKSLLDDAPNVGSFTDTLEVQLGSDVQMDVEGTGRLLGGVVQSFDLHQDGDAKQSWVWDARVIDYMWMLNARRPFGCWTEISATTVINELMSEFAPAGYTVNGVVAGLAAVTVSFDGSLTFSECLAEIAAQLGGAHFFVDEDQDLHFFFEEVTDNPQDVDDDNMLLQLDQPITMSQDMSQIRNRIFVKGAGAQLLADASAGATELQVDAGVEIFDENGGEAIIGCNRIRYTTVRRTLIYPPPTESPAIPGAAPSAIDSLGLKGYTENGPIKTNVRYSTSFVTNGVESPRGGPATFAPYRVSISISSATASTDTNGFLPSGTHDWRFAIIASDGSAYYTIFFNLQATLTAPGSVTFELTTGFSSNELRPSTFRLYRFATINGESDYYEAASVPAVGDVPITITDNKAPESLGNPLPAFAGTPTFVIYDTIGIRVWLIASSIPSGPTGTTQRRIYREEQYAFNVGDNWTTPELIRTIDGNTTPAGPSPYLGYIEDTKPTRANLYDFGPDAPAVTTPAAPAEPPKVRIVLFGVTGLDEDVHEGDELSIFLQRDDLTSQVACAVREGGTGLHEFFVSDANLRSSTALQRRADAELEMYSEPIVTVKYSTRDTKSTSGKTVNFNLTQPPIVASGLKITESEVSQIHEFSYNGGLPVTQLYKVTASSLRYTLGDLLRRAVIRGS